jgi:hypothetical protein
MSKPRKPQPALAFKTVEHIILLSDKELSQAWASLYNQTNPRLKKLQNLKEEEWLYLAEYLSATLEALELAQQVNQVH